MTFLRRLFSSTYRKAVAAEAAGDFQSAARCYALCGDRQKAVEMHLALSKAEQKVEPQINYLHAGLGFTTSQDPIRATVLRQLGLAYQRKAEELGPSTIEGQQSLREAASYFEQGKFWNKAGDCYLALDQQMRAVTVFSKAGLVEKVEEILAQQEHIRRKRRQEEERYKDYEAFLQGGQRDQAVDSLRSCIEAAQQKGEYRRLLADLEQRLILNSSVTLSMGDKKLRLIGRLPCLLGRDDACDLQVRGPSVSRQHAQIQRSISGELEIQDEHSSNGTQLNGLGIRAPMPLMASGILALGNSCEIKFELIDSVVSLLKLSVRKGFDKDLLVFIAPDPAYSFDLHRLLEYPFPLKVAFIDGRPIAQATSGDLILNQERVIGEVQLIRGDKLRVGTRSLEVKG